MIIPDANVLIYAHDEASLWHEKARTWWKGALSGVEPREWFLAPLAVIQEAIGKLMDGTIQDYRYDPESARLVKA